MSNSSRAASRSLLEEIRRETPLVKIGIFRDDGQVVAGGILPDRSIQGIVQADIPNMNGIGVKIDRPFTDRGERF